MSSVFHSYAQKPTPSNYLSPVTPENIFGLDKGQMESKQISDYLKISATIIRSTIPKEYQQGKENQSRGWYFKITKLQAKAIVKEALKNRHTTYCKIAKKGCTYCFSQDSKQNNCRKAF